MSIFAEDIGRRRALYRLAIARSDIRAAQEIAAYAERHVTEINELWIPLQDALVAAYARPFTSNKPLGPLAARWSKFGNPRYQELHNELIQLRHELVAHADASQRMVVIFPPYAQPPTLGLEPTSQATLAVVHKRRAPGFFVSVGELCNDLLVRLHAAVQDELQALFGGIGGVRPFDLLTGEERAVDMTGSIISAGRIPGNG